LEVFTTPIITFEDTLDHQKTIVPIGLQILNQVELVETIGAEFIKEVINQLVAKGQSSLGL
jgi:hypothetical protein